MRLHRIFIALTLASLMFACSHALKDVKVTTQTLVSQPANQRLVLDLSNDGTIYDVAGDVDYDRVLIRTAPGEMLMSRMLKLINMPRGAVLLGTFDDLSGGRLLPADDGPPQRPGGGASPAKCADFDPFEICWCIGRVDCRDMSRARLCTHANKTCGVGSDHHWGCVCVNGPFNPEPGNPT
jgi:hypothetical protein